MAITLTDKQMKYSTVLANDLACSATATVYSNKVPVAGSDHHGIWIKCSSSGNVDVKVYVELSYDDTTANFVTPESGSEVIEVTDKLAHVDGFTVPGAAWMRFKFVGQAGNHASTTIQLVFYRDNKGW